MQQLTHKKRKKKKMSSHQLIDETSNAEQEEEEEEKEEEQEQEEEEKVLDDAEVDLNTKTADDNDDVKPDNGTADGDTTVVDREIPLSWSCCYCVKEFDNRWSLARHEKIHTGEKPYKCHICDKDFIQKCSLRRHIKIHSDDKPFQCTHPNCGKRFKLKEYLDMHRRVHLSSGEPVEEDFDRSQSLSNLLENSMASNEDRALM
jgi:uncharacterized Zn-finger protein